MAWSYPDAWRGVAAELGLRVEGPCTINLDHGVTIRAEMWVRDFGNTNGTLVVADFEEIACCAEGMKREGYFGSSFGPYRHGEEADRDGVIDCLADWGWFGQGEPPTWYQKARAELEEVWRQEGLLEEP